MSVRRELLALVAFAAVALACTALLWTTLSGAVGGATRTYVAEFTDVSGLRAGDDVRIAGVPVGRVDGLVLDGDRAAVTLTVRADHPVFENTRALIRYENLVGLRFVALVPGPGPARPLPGGARIPVERTEPSFDLSVLMNGFAPLFSVLEPAEVNRLSERIVAVLQGAGPELGPLLDETATLTAAIADRDEVIGAVLTDLGAVLDQVGGKGPELDALLAQSRRLADGLAGRTDEVFGALERIRGFSATAADLLADVRPDLRADVLSAVDVTGLFVRERAAVEDTLVGLPGFLGGVARTGQYGSWVNLYTCEAAVAGPGGELAVPQPPGGEPHTEVCR